MTHAEFHKAIGEIANGRYYSTQVDASTTYRGGTKTDLVFKAYIDGYSWTESANPEHTVIQMRDKVNGCEPSLADVYPTPESVPV